MNIERIKEIQDETAHPHSVSVQQALLSVWNECEQSPQQENEKLKMIVFMHNHFIDKKNARIKELEEQIERLEAEKQIGIKIKDTKQKEE